MSSSPNKRDDRGAVNRGVAWVGVASSAVAFLDIIAHIIILAFWVSKEEFGIAVLAISLFPVLDLATDLGITAAVIQRDDHTEDKVSTVFWINFTISVLIFVSLAVGIGPLLSWLHDQPILRSLITAYGAKLIWQNVYYVPDALMKRELRFKELSIIRILANVAEFAAKVGFAAAGFGVWCFVIAPLFRVLVTGIGIQLRHPWRPRFTVKIREAFDWLSFGVKASAHRMLFHVYTNVDYQVVGYYFGEAANGMYTLAYKIVLEPALVISEIITQVALPAFSKLKYERDRLVDQLIGFSRMNLVVMLGFLGIVFVSSTEVLALFSNGSDFTPAAPVVRILCAVAVLRALSFLLPPLLDGLGRPSLALAYTMIAAVLLPGLFVIFSITLGPYLDFMSVALAWAVGYPVAFAVLLGMVLTLLDLRLREFLRPLVGILLCALVAGVASYAVAAAAAAAPAWLRLTLSSSTMVAVFFVLLAHTQGISPRSVARALKAP